MIKVWIYRGSFFNSAVYLLSLLHDLLKYKQIRSGGVDLSVKMLLKHDRMKSVKSVQY